MRPLPFLQLAWAVALCSLPFTNPGLAQPAPPAGSSKAHVQRPSNTAAPAAVPDELRGLDDATAQCRDGYLSYDKPSTRTCADHGGVHKWLPGPDKALIR
jgi:hypothetical protein